MSQEESVNERERAEEALERSVNSGYIESGPAEKFWYVWVNEGIDSSIITAMRLKGFAFSNAFYEENGEGNGMYKLMFFYRGD